MLYLQNTTESQVLFVPKNEYLHTNTLTFVATSTIDLDTKINVQVTLAHTSNLYAIFLITLPSGVPDGEYEYVLQDHGFELSKGLLMVTGEGRIISQYNKSITYEQYETSE